MPVLPKVFDKVAQRHISTRTANRLLADGAKPSRFTRNAREVAYSPDSNKLLKRTAGLAKRLYDLRQTRICQKAEDINTKRAVKALTADIFDKLLKQQTISVLVQYDGFVVYSNPKPHITAYKDQTFSTTCTGLVSKRQLKRHLTAKWHDMKSMNGTYTVFTTNFRFSFTAIERREGSLESVLMFKSPCKLMKQHFGLYEDSGSGMCVIEALRHLYGSKIPSVMNDDFLCELMSPDDPRDLEDGWNVLHIDFFVRRYNIPMYALDRNERIFFTHIPEKRNKKYPALVFIVSNDHMYLCTNKRYVQSVSEKAKPIVSSNTVKEKEAVEKEIDYSCHDFVADETLLTKYFELYKRDNTLYDVENVGGQIKAILCGDKHIYSNPHKDFIVNCIQQLKAKHDIDFKFCNQTPSNFGKALFAKLYPHHKQSCFNTRLMQTILSKDFKRGGFVHTFGHPLRNDIQCVDIAKCHTACMLHNKYEWCVFNAMDTIEPYDNKGYHRVGFYYVETSNFFPLRGNGWYHYGTLLECEEFSIPFAPTYQLIASDSLPPDYFRKFVETISSLDADWKLLSNATIGNLRKVDFYKYKTHFTTSYDEAVLEYWSNVEKPYTTFISTHTQSDGEQLYEVTKQWYHQSLENDIPIYNQILENNFIMVYKLAQKMGGRLLMAKTDMVCVEGGTMPELGTNAIGGYREEPVPERFYVSDRVLNKEPRVYEALHWETSMKETQFGAFDGIVDYVIEANKGCNIDGRAGTGKSELVRRMNAKCDEMGMKYMNLAFTNKAARNITGSTIHKALAISNGRMNKKKLLQFRHIDWLFIDEISMIGSQLWTYLMILKQYAPNVKMVLVGDWRQLPPVGEEDRDFQNSDIIKILSDYAQVELVVNKRSDCVMRGITDKVWETGKVEYSAFGKQPQDLSICFTNRTRKKLNKRMMDVMQCRGVDGVKIPALEDDEYTQDVYLSVGTPVMARENNKALDILNNEDFKVSSTTCHSVCLSNENRCVTVKHAEFQKLFCVAYAITVHKSQGATFNRPYAIYESRRFSKKMLYTALTRTTKQEYVNFVPTDPDRYQACYSSTFIKMKLHGYKSQDAAKYRKFELDVNDVKKLIADGCNECYHCGLTLSPETLTLDRVNDLLGHQRQNVLLSPKNRAFYIAIRFEVYMSLK